MFMHPTVLAPSVIRRDHKWAYITHYTYHTQSHLHHKIESFVIK